MINNNSQIERNWGSHLDCTIHELLVLVTKLLLDIKVSQV